MSPAPDISTLLPDDATLRARREALVLELRPPRSPRRSFLRPRRVALALAALLALSGGGAWAAGVFSADDVVVGPGGVVCLNRPSLHANATITHSTADPVAKCAKLWREGVVDTRRGPASPHLVACTAENAGVDVFPGPDELCERLGLAPLPGDYAPRGAKAGRVYTAWGKVLRHMQVLPAGRCRSPQRLAKLARSRLSTARYRDVRVVIEKGGACAEGIEVRRDHIKVQTESRVADRQRSFGERAGRAVLPLIKKAVLTCIPPEQFAADARKILDGAGLSEIAIRVGRKYDPCVGAGWGSNLAKNVIFFAGDSYKDWKLNRRTAGRWASSP